MRHLRLNPWVARYSRSLLLSSGSAHVFAICAQRPWSLGFGKSLQITFVSPFTFKSLDRFVLQIALFAHWVSRARGMGGRGEMGSGAARGRGGREGRGGQGKGRKRRKGKWQEGEEEREMRTEEGEGSEEKGREAKRRGGNGGQSLYTSHHLPIARACSKYW